jgi:hypothetical protein
LQLSTRRHPGDIILRRRRPAQLAQAFLGRREQGINHLVPFQDLRHLDHLPEEERQLVKSAFQPDELGPVQAGVPVRHAEGQAGDAVCRDGKARFS